MSANGLYKNSADWRFFASCVHMLLSQLKRAKDATVIIQFSKDNNFYR